MRNAEDSANKQQSIFLLINLKELINKQSQAV